MELSILLNFILILVIAIRQIRIERKIGELAPPKDVHSESMDIPSKVTLDNVESPDNVKWGVIDGHLCLLWDEDIVLYIDKKTKKVWGIDFVVGFDSKKEKSLNKLFKKFK